MYYRNLGVTRDDHDARKKAAAINFSFFNAPHVALLFMPVVGDNVRVAGDLGMYGQTLSLALAARGLGGVPPDASGSVRRYGSAGTRNTQPYEAAFGMSFGYSDEAAPANRERLGRDHWAKYVLFHS